MNLKNLIFALLISLSGAANAYSKPVTVVASIFPFADVAKKIGGELVEVHVLLRPGRDPHHYEPTPGDARKIDKAKIVLRAGYGVDDWVLKLVESVGQSGQEVIDLSKTVQNPLKSKGHNAHGNVNPHYWLDPGNMIDVAESIANALMKAMPDKKEEIGLSMTAYIKSLKVLDWDIKDILSGEGVGKNYVASHNAWRYFARRYQLREVGLIRQLPGQEPSARHIAGLIEMIKKYKLKAILIDAQSSPGVSQTIADEADVRLIPVDPIGGVAGRDSYIGLMLWNAARFKDALSR